MICYNCGLKIQNSNTKECHFCGVKFGNNCTSCNSPNPVMAKFCCHCGSAMTMVKEASSVQNYSTLAESRKNVAVLFADVSGFTALSEKLDPEIVREIINDCFTYITAPVYELGGTIDKYIGDCVMVLFGAKTSHIDDAKRAVLCAMEMSRLIKEFSQERVKYLGFDLQLSIGVHYGLVVTGRVGNYFDMDYTVMGDTVNTAQRIQSNTPKSCIYVSDAVFQETYTDIEYQGPYEIKAKNKENPVSCYMPSTVRNQLNTSKESIQIVGRDCNLKALADARETSAQNTSLIVGITGAAGMGKSTLVEEFLKHCKSEQKIIKTECSPSLINSPYSLINNLLMQMMNINAGETLIVKQSRIISYISFLLEKYEEEVVKRNYQFISFLMGMEIDKETRDIIASMDVKSIYKEIFNQLTLLFHEFENRFQFILLLEDLHWGDAKSIKLLRDLWISTASNNSKNLYLYTSRNSIEVFEALSVEKHVKMQLQPLASEDIHEYIKRYINCKNVDPSFAAYITSFSDGNPLYMYELLKYIRKSSFYSISKGTVFLKQDIEKIPNSLQGLIMSKLNFMSQEATETVQAASIVGKNFSVSVLSKLMKRDMEEDASLREAVNNNIISLKSTNTYGGRMEKLYSFSHDTERETIYNSILNKKKVSYHRETAKAIESLYSRNIESYYEVLGEHFEKGEEPAKASDYYRYAAEHYKNLFNTQEALAYYLKAQQCISKHKKATPSKLYTLYIEIGELYSILSDFKNAKSFLSKALKLADSIDEKWLVELALVRIYKEQAKYKQAMDILNEIQAQLKPSNELYGSLLFLKCSIQRVTGQSQEALVNIKRAERILVKNKDYKTLAKVLNAAGAIYHTTSDIANALKLYLKAYHYSEKTGDLLTLVKCAGNMATIFHIQGDLSNASKYFNIAMDLSKKISHLQSYVTNSNNLGILYLDKGQFAKAKVLFEEAARISKENSILFMQSASISNLSDVEYYMGDYKNASKYAMQALEISRQIEDIEGEGINNISLAKISIEQHLYLQAKAYLDAALDIYRKLDIEDGWSDYHYYSAQYFLELMKLEQALEQAQKAYDFATECRNNRKQAKSARMLGIILQKKGEFQASLVHFDDSIALFEKEEANYELAKNYYLRAVSNKGLNKAQAAKKDLQAAHTYIKKIDKCKWTKIIEQDLS